MYKLYQLLLKTKLNYVIKCVYILYIVLIFNNKTEGTVRYINI